MSILELAAKAKATLPAIETAVTQKGLIKQIDLITIQTKEMRVTRAGLSKEEQVALDRKLKQLHKRKIELEDMLEHNDIQEAASVETAASFAAQVTKELKELEKLVDHKFPAKIWAAAKKAKDEGLSVTNKATSVLLQNGFNQYGQKAFSNTPVKTTGIKYDWYKYVGARGTKITNSRGNREVILKNGSMFGVHPATTTAGKVRIVTAELGPTIVFSFDQEGAVKIIQKGVRIPVKVTFKRPEAPAIVKKAAAAAKKAAKKPRSADEVVGGFTQVELDRMVRSLKSNGATVKKYVKQLGLQGMTTKAAVAAIREYRGR